MPIITLPNPEYQQYDEFGRPIIVPRVAQNLASMPAPEIQQQQASLPVQQVPQAPADFSRIPPVQMAAPLPSQEQQIPLPKREDYQPSRLRTVLNAIAGGLAGAAGHPETGAFLRDLPYKRAMEDYGYKTKDQERRAGIESERVKRAEFEIGEGIKRGQAQSLDVSRTANAEAAKSRAQTAADEHARKVVDDARKAKATDVSIKAKEFAMTHPATPWQYLETIDPSDTEAVQAAMDTIRQFKAAETKPEKPLGQIEAESAARTRGMLSAGADPAAMQGVQKKAEATAVGTEEGKPGLDDATIANIARTAQTDPGSAEAVINKLSPKQKIQVYQNMGIPPHLSVREQDRIYSSKITYAHAKTLENMVNDPWIKSHMGPLLGRVMSAEGLVGGNPIGGTPAEAKKEGEFLNFLSYVIAWESTNLSAGTRPAWQLVQMLKRTGPKAAMTPERFLGAVQAIKTSVKNTLAQVAPGVIPTLDQTGTEKPKKFTITR